MSFKAREIAAELADELKIRMSALALSQTNDANGDPVITLGAGVALGRNAVIRVKAIEWALAKDSLGLPATIYTPHVIQIASEANYAATSDNVADTLTTADLLALLATCSKRGTRVEWWQEATGTPPAVTTFDTASKLKATYEAELYWGMKASQ